MSQTETFRKLLREKFAPANDRENVFCSIILALSERVDTLGKQNSELAKAARFLAKVVGEMKGEETEEAVTEKVREEYPDRDKTPFPANVKAETTGPATLDETLAAQEVPTPDAASQPAVNAAPIPVSAPKNGTKSPLP